jgi:3D (Asp-Asp-Asp) domain-containing protein
MITNKRIPLVLFLSLAAVLIGVLLAVPSRAEPRAARTLTVRATHYCASCGGSRTATGRSGRTRGLAVDPRVIPLGSRVYVPGHGVLVADDTGGAIRGRRIDIRLTSRGGCARRGVKRLTVRVVGRPKSRRDR